MSRPPLPAVPRVGVCVPAYDEADRLRGLLRSLLLLDYPPGYCQVVVAVDGAEPRTVAVAREHGVTVLELPENRGSYAARNAAADALHRPVDIILFTDADCVVPPTWVKDHVRTLIESDTSGGGVHFGFRPKPSPAEFVDSVRHLQQAGYVRRDGFAATCNLAVRMPVFDALRFDEMMRTGGDADFGRRAREAGFTIAYSPEAFVEHPARRTDAEVMRKVRRIAGGVEGQRSRWEARPRPQPARLNRGVWMRARAEGHQVSWLWGVHAALLNYWATRTINRAVKRMLDSRLASEKRRPGVTA